MTERAAGTVAVLGTGTMGPGIAVAFAQTGHRVIVWGRARERLERVPDRVRGMVAFLAEHGLCEAPDRVLGRIDLVDSLGAIGPADVVVEAIVEDLGAKRELLARVEEVCGDEALLASTTSGLRVSDLAAELRRPERVVAMHFWNPAHLMPIVEVSGGERTSEVAVRRARDLARAIGKVPVVLRREVLGFLGTRMQQAVVREAIALLESGVASAEDIDLAVRTSFGVRFPVLGPLESADLSGLEVIEAIHRYLLPDLDRSTEPQAALRERVARGEVGVKSGRGFYDWTTRDAAVVVRRRDEELVRRIRLLAAEGALRLPEGASASRAGGVTGP